MKTDRRIATPSNANAQAPYSESGIPVNGQMIWLPSCDLCGALVLNKPIHNRWHYPV